jgi:tetratricopeptide (TPR) repeat protein
MSTHPCPSVEDLERLLAEQLSDPECEAVARHVEGCAGCREALARLTEGAGDDPWPPGPLAGSPPAFLEEFARSPPPGLGAPGPATDTPGGPGATPPPGVRPQVPGYEILEELGRGGMGVVYKARHLALQRLVALKVLLAGEHAGPAQLARFRGEAEALARLRHPHIVQVYEVGEQGGLPFFALELVDGASLAGRLGGAPQPAREAARLIEALARAVHAAHQQGVIHRDLKPANILLTADGAPKITDFGLAKRVDVVGVPTQSGDIVGTPSYMAPEQARGDRRSVGPASDVYALGAILYELLTGRPPFRAVTPLDTLLHVLYEEPVPPRRLQPKVPRDLETICLKCLHKEPRQRYASALALAEDLRRFLAGEPIVARPSGLLGRGAKWARRRPAVTALLALLAAVLVGGFFGMMGLWLKAEAARQGEAAQRDRAEQEKRVAEAVRAFLERDLLRQADPGEQADALRQAGGGFQAQENPRIQELLDRAAAELAPDKIEAKFPHQPEVQASILKTVGDTYRGIGAYGRAVEFLRRSSDTYRDALGADHPDTLTTLNNLATAYSYAGQTAEAIALFEQVRDALEKKLGADHPDTLVTLDSLAATYRAAGQTAEAIGLGERVRDARVRKLGADHPDTLNTLSNLAYAYQAQGRYDEAEPLYQEALAGRRRQLGADHPSTLTTLNNLAYLYNSRARYPEAEPLYQEALGGCRRTLGPDHPLTLATLNNLAGLYWARGRYAEAEPLLQEALAGQRRRLGADHPDALVSLNNLALLYQSRGRYAEAEPLYQEALAGHRRTLGADHPFTLQSLNNLAGLYQDSGRYAEAEPLFQEALAGRRRRLGADHPLTLQTLNNLALLYKSRGRYDQAESLCQEALAGRRRRLGADHPDTLGSLNNLAKLYESRGRYDQAEPLLLEAVAGARRKLGLAHPTTQTFLGNAAGLYERAGRPEKAEPLWRELAEAAKQQAGPESPPYAARLASLGANLLKQQKPAEAEPLLRTGLTIRQGKEPDAWTTFHTRSLLGEALARQKKYAEAESLLRAGYEGLQARAQAIPPKGQRRLTEALERLVQLYDAWGKPEQAKEWRQTLEQAKTPRKGPIK